MDSLMGGHIYSGFLKHLLLPCKCREEYFLFDLPHQSAVDLRTGGFGKDGLCIYL
jgi:hypothetical protein